ncbi:MAG: chitobiase/beta-hexosaminidase C-terminal domain-containing protein [Polyangiaceae bacterium]
MALASSLAAGGTMAGCSGGSGGSSGSGGPEASTDGNQFDSAKETGPETSTDTGADVIEAGVDATPEAEAAPPQCPAPTFAPASGAVDPGNVTITDTGLPANGFIFYTTDGTNPNQNSPVYAGPIQVSASETIRAAAIAPTCSESNVSVATYTVTPFDGGGLPAPTLNPSSQISDNDFLVSLSDTGGATICFTLDGTTPTCTNGACTGTSQTYNAASRVSVNGTVTGQSGPTQGKVTLTAIACEAGFINSGTG